MKAIKAKPYTQPTRTEIEIKKRLDELEITISEQAEKIEKLESSISMNNIILG